MHHLRISSGGHHLNTLAKRDRPSATTIPRGVNRIWYAGLPATPRTSLTATNPNEARCRLVAIALAIGPPTARSSSVAPQARLSERNWRRMALAYRRPNARLNRRHSSIVPDYPGRVLQAVISETHNVEAITPEPTMRQVPCLARSRDGRPCTLMAPHEGVRHQANVYRPPTTVEFD